MRSVRAALLALALLWPASAQAAAARVTSGVVTIEAPAERREALDRLAVDAPRIIDAVQGDMRARFAGRVRVVLIPPGVRWSASEPPLDSTLNRLDAQAPAWAAGWAIPERRLVVIRIAEASRWPYGTVAAVLAHELTHVLTHDVAGEALPRWLDEGLASWQARRFSFTDAVAVSSALLTRPLPRFAELDASFTASTEEAQVAYAGSFAFVAWSARRYGEAFPARLVAAARRHPWEEAWMLASGESFPFAERTWRRSALLAFRWVPIAGGTVLLWGMLALGFAVTGVARRNQQRRARAQLPDDPEWSEPGEAPDSDPEPPAT